MRIATIGAGKMAHTLGSLWVAAGHEVYVGARRAAEGQRVGNEIGGEGGAIENGLADADVVLLSVPGTAAAEVAATAAAGDSINGKVLIDCSNALGHQAFAAPPDSFVLEIPAVAETVAQAAPSANVVKAFNLLAAEVWSSPAREFDGQHLLVPVCGDDDTAVLTTSQLVTDAGGHPIRAGNLTRARYAESTTAFIMGLWFAGHDARAMLPPLAATAAR
ncbi:MULTISPECIES: NADPH-dependent F420 reductase [unclassified Nocardioides]|uniref:NADPH-dependent F420 reductase n=1 Tax=unclassified Nocardioides TaxID=2615069 RepID=UPI0009F06EDE|nr:MULTISPECIES: NAD(P)-binding domain-containing protein [unclassified Nocardioides]GAW48008.1 NADP oxidoreductase coenzyme F420-dependent [Nocardioides sp. PD653-B2]GAW53689.1 NADP oxidoreductase coenzyme F420-dependent [Nocardioides sp. PD653]